MMLPSEHIQDETEFKHICSESGKEAIKILEYIAKDLKERAFLHGTKDAERNVLAKKVANINEFITQIQNVAEATAPDMNF
ncbi:hypothetical protein GFM72_21100 [Salmonella enterica]|nr:hypothetical protein [Salmonella enterica]